MKKPCPNSDELQVCPDCKEWTGVCDPCCGAGELCDECDGSGTVDEDEDPVARAVDECWERNR